MWIIDAIDLNGSFRAIKIKCVCSVLGEGLINLKMSMHAYSTHFFVCSLLFCTLTR